MKLAIIRHRHAQFGGAERFIETIAGELARTGNELSIIAEFWPGGTSGSVSQIAIPSRGLTRVAKFANFQREIAEVVARGDFDLVQTHERLTTADIFRAGDGVHAAWLARLAAEDGPLRALVRRFDGMHRLLTETERRMARETDMIFVANSGLVAREIADWLDVPPGRIRTIENGVDRARFSPPSQLQRADARKKFGLGPDALVVAYVGSGFQRKGAFALVDALGLPACRGIHALIAGRDRQIEALRRRAEKRAPGGRVQILGGADDPLPVYHAADVFALPSLYDPMPNAALEALACGLPLVVTADTGIADAVRDHGAGAIVTRAPDDIARGIIDVLGRRADATKAIMGALPRFDLSAATSHWLALYRELA